MATFAQRGDHNAPFQEAVGAGEGEKKLNSSQA